MAKFKYYDGTNWVELLPTTGGTLTGTIYGAQSGKGIVFQSTDSNGGSWSEGIYILDTSHNNYSTLTLGNSDKTDLLSFVHNGAYHSYYLDIQRGNNYYQIHFPQASGTLALTSDLSGYLPLSGGTLSGLLSVSPNNISGNYDEGIRLHPYSNWSTIMFCANDNSGNTGTSANSWSIHNNEGTFGAYKNGSNISSASTGFANSNGSWTFKGQTDILAINSDTALNLRSSTGNSYLGFYNGNGNALGWLGVNGSNQPIFNVSGADYLIALKNDLRKINSTYYERLGSCYDGGNNHGFVRITIPTNPSWGMVLLECSVRQSYSTPRFGKLLIYCNIYSNSVNVLNAYTNGCLSLNVKGYVDTTANKSYIYITDMGSWSGLSLDRMVLGDAITGTDFTNNIVVEFVDELPESGVVTANIFNNATTADLSNALSNALSGYMPLSGNSTKNGYINIEYSSTPGSMPALSINYDNNNGGANLGDNGLNMIKFGNIDNYIGQIPANKSHLGVSTFGLHTDSSHGFEFITSGWTWLATLSPSGVFNAKGGLQVNGTNVALTSDLSNYLPLTGGAISNAITRDAGGGWIEARNNCVIKTTRTSSAGSDWHPAVGIKTSNGFWSFGSVGGETLCLSYDTDTDYANSSNNSAVINFPSAGSTGTLALISDIPNVPSWALQSSKPSYNYSEIGAGNIVQGNATGYYSYRQGSGVRAGFYYHSAGDESTVFCNEYEGAGWMFVNGYIPEDHTNWQSLTPTLQIKRGGVAIGKLIGQSATPTYNLDVNGTANATTIYENGTQLSSKYLQLSGGTLTSGLAVVDDSSNNSYDALVYLRTFSSNDWGLLIDKNGQYDYGLRINCSQYASYALDVYGSSQFHGDISVSGSISEGGTALSSKYYSVNNPSGYITSSGSCASATSAGSATVADNVSYIDARSNTSNLPSSANTSGQLKFVLCASEPSTKYDGYVYLILS